jgi:Leucine-rich repeat (LRR) protein
MNGVFEGLQCLEELDASYNFLETLSPSVGLMRKLMILRLDANRLNNIPTGIFFINIYSSKYLIYLYIFLL